MKLSHSISSLENAYKCRSKRVDNTEEAAKLF